MVMVVLIAGCGRVTAAAPHGPEVVVTADGPVRGSVAGGPDGGFRLFQGIPYAAAPVGPLRWQPPAAPVPWTEVRDATRPGLRCIQDTRADPDFGRPTGEDCLNLSVWTPDGAGPASP
jgi:para-nitrobenzyl esterase